VTRGGFGTKAPPLAARLEEQFSPEFLRTDAHSSSLSRLRVRKSVRANVTVRVHVHVCVRVIESVRYARVRKIHGLLSSIKVCVHVCVCTSVFVCVYAYFCFRERTTSIVRHQQSLSLFVYISGYKCSGPLPPSRPPALPPSLPFEISSLPCVYSRVSLPPITSR